MMRGQLSWGVVLLAFACVVVGFFASDAMAQAVGSAGSYSCSAGTVTGQLYDSGATCPTELKIDNVFSFLVCNMEQLSSNLIGSLYCGMITKLAPAVWAAITMAVMFFGISFLIGLTPATGGEAIKFLIKIAFISAFATNADYLIGIGYRGLVGGINDGVTIALSNFTGGATSAYTMLDNALATLFSYATDGMAQADAKDSCKNAVFAVLATMFVAFPMVAYVGMLLIARVMMTFFRAVFGYIYAIVGITFLLALSPFFLTFLLFKQTSSFFDRWLGYLVSFALQAVLLFVFLAFVLGMIQKLGKDNVVEGLTEIIMYHEQSAEARSFRMPWQYCTLCDFKVVDKTDPSKELTDNNSKDYIEKGKLVCKDAANPKPITMTFAAAPAGDVANSKAQIGHLLKFAGEGLISLIVMAMIIEQLLTLIPNLAQRLASGLAMYAPQIGGGTSGTGGASLGIPGESFLRDFGAGYRSGYLSGGAKNTVSASMQGVKQGMESMVVGKRADGTIAEGASGEGVAGTFMRWISDPNRFGH